MRVTKQGLKEAIGLAVAAGGLALALLSVAPASARAQGQPINDMPINDMPTTDQSINDQPIVGVVDQARLVKIPDGTDTLIIGNSTIADVTLLKQKNIMVLTPKAFGETNFIALDAHGNALAQSTIRVVNSSDAIVVQRGMERQSYSCAPKCQPTERLGDDEAYLENVAKQNESHLRRLAGAR